MSISSYIVSTSRDAADVTSLAESLYTSMSQDWENESTIYVFADESVLIVKNDTFKSLTD